MAISIICAWIAVLSLILTAAKFIVKKNKKLNMFFRKIHIPAGIVLVISGLIHGLLAGNSRGASLSGISIGEELFSLNLGTICFVLAVALGISYCLRKKLEKRWFNIHRVLTVMIIAVLVIHVAEVGISLPEFLKADEAQEIIEVESVDNMIDSNTTTVTANVTDDANTGLPEQLDVEFSGAKLKDGTYTGSSEGYKSTIKVSVTVEGGSVKSVEVVSQNETPKFWNNAKSLTNTIVSNQSLEVDAVSGATYSSKGILCAVYDALEDAVYDGTLNITIPEPRGRKH